VGAQPAGSTVDKKSANLSTLNCIIYHLTVVKLKRHRISFSCFFHSDVTFCFRDKLFIAHRTRNYQICVFLFERIYLNADYLYRGSTLLKNAMPIMEFTTVAEHEREMMC
jgi:hypothetical protein